MDEAMMIRHVGGRCAKGSYHNPPCDPPPTPPLLTEPSEPQPLTAEEIPPCEEYEEADGLNCIDHPVSYTHFCVPCRTRLTIDAKDAEIARLREALVAKNLIDAGYRIVKNDPDHYVCFTEDTWFIEHSLDCRIAGTIGTCEFNHAIIDLADELPAPPEKLLGRWRIVGITDGRPDLEPVHA